MNSQERVEKLYQINEQRKAYKKQIDHCTKAVDSLTKIAVEMNLESKEFVSHNLDLQAGLLGSLKKEEILEKKLSTLQAKRVKRFGIGPAVGVDIKGNGTAALTIQYSLIQF